MSDSTFGPRAETIAGLLADTTPYLSCDDCFARMDVYVEQRRAAPRVEDPAMEAHLAGCSVCADEVAALEELLDRDDGRGAPPTG